MGHDISAYRIKKVIPKLHFDQKTEVEADEKEIAYLRFGAFNKVGQKIFYDSLNAQQFNASCSGDGSKETYTIEQIKEAKRKLNASVVPHYDSEQHEAATKIAKFYDDIIAINETVVIFFF